MAKFIKIPSENIIKNVATASIHHKIPSNGILERDLRKYGIKYVRRVGVGGKNAVKSLITSRSEKILIFISQQVLPTAGAHSADTQKTPPGSRLASSLLSYFTRQCFQIEHTQLAKVTTPHTKNSFTLPAQ